MNIMGIINPILAIGGMGAVFGVGLGIAAKKFAVPIDLRVDEVRECLPGANCGGCGFAGCDAFAKGIVSGEAKINGCPVSSEAQREEIGKIMGLQVEALEPTVAIVRCQGNLEVAKDKYVYQGIGTCQDAHLLHGGPKGCRYGCLGLGSCVSACPFDAIHIVKGVAQVDPEKCKSCSACVAVCPRNLIYIGSAQTSYQVKCMSYDKGKDVKVYCGEGCIGCTLCVKQCAYDAITMHNQLATIDQSKCVACGKCEEKCPTKAIRKLIR